MILQQSTWVEVEAYLKVSSGIVIPIGSTEQHGPTGLIGTDAICPETIAHHVARNRDVLVGPTISIGMAQHHLAFPGTIAFRPSTLLAIVRDIVASLRAHGFTHVLFLNGHGGNIDTLKAAFSEIYAETSMGTAQRPSVRCHLANWWRGDRVQALSRELFADGEGSHATPSEISLTYHAYPDAVRRIEMKPKVAGTGTIRDAADFRRQFPDGRIGSDPSLASAEHGARLLEAAAEDTTREYDAFITSS